MIDRFGLTGSDEIDDMRDRPKRRDDGDATIYCFVGTSVEGEIDKEWSGPVGLAVSARASSRMESRSSRREPECGHAEEATPAIGATSKRATKSFLNGEEGEVGQLVVFRMIGGVVTACSWVS